MNKKQQDYDTFVEKFKPKKTTDDCYTPPYVYDAVLEWAKENLPMAGKTVVRPFFPGGDYEHFEYPPDAVVIDNPPFSIYTQIVEYFNKRNIPFLLFAPGLTAIRSGVTFIASSARVVYENGAYVMTDFVTNMMPGTLCITAPRLKGMITQAVKQAKAEKRKTVKHYRYPGNVLRVSELHTMVVNGIPFSVSSREGQVFGPVVKGTSAFGNSFLLNDHMARAKKDAMARATAAKQDKDNAVTKHLELSDKAREIIEQLNSKPES